MLSAQDVLKTEMKVVKHRFSHGIIGDALRPVFFALERFDYSEKDSTEYFVRIYTRSLTRREKNEQEEGFLGYDYAREIYVSIEELKTMIDFVADVRALAKEPFTGKVTRRLPIAEDFVLEHERRKPNRTYVVFQFQGITMYDKSSRSIDLQESLASLLRMVE